MIRQMATSLAGIRDDHVERYRFAQRFAVGNIIDAGCGVGYGAQLVGAMVAFDFDPDAIEHAKTYFPGPIYQCRDLAQVEVGRCYGTLIMFEVIEHTPDALTFLKRSYLQRLIGSVPNELVVPYDPAKSNPQHYRHFTPNELRAVLADCGWTVREEWGQVGKRGADAQVTPGFDGKRTLVFVAAAWRDAGGDQLVKEAGYL